MKLNVENIKFGQTPFFTERLLAGLIDMAIAAGLSLFPQIGWIFGLIYFLFKDCLPFINGQSFGRKLFNIKVVSRKTQTSLVANADKAVIRQIIFFVPVLNIVELVCFLFYPDRLGSKWSDTEIIKC